MAKAEALWADAAGRATSFAVPDPLSMTMMKNTAYLEDDGSLLYGGHPR